MWSAKKKKRNGAVVGRWCEHVPLFSANIFFILFLETLCTFFKSLWHLYMYSYRERDELIIIHRRLRKYSSRRERNESESLYYGIALIYLCRNAVNCSLCSIVDFAWIDWRRIRWMKLGHCYGHRDEVLYVNNKMCRPFTPDCNQLTYLYSSSRLFLLMFIILYM